jgi:hypothetical protein
VNSGDFGIEGVNIIYFTPNFNGRDGVTNVTVHQF